MSDTAEKSDPALWDKVKDEVTAGAKGGRKGQWSARKAQLAVAEYKKRGGGYKGSKDADNSLHQWTEEDWSTKSGERSEDTGERYLPKKALAGLSDEEYARTTAKKRADKRKGKQFSAQPHELATKIAAARDPRTRDQLYAEARDRRAINDDQGATPRGAVGLARKIGATLTGRPVVQGMAGRGGLPGDMRCAPNGAPHKSL
ncbi:DUF5872 domain-containing protein [Sphingomonas sp. 8AM]|uniref:DUF5872 domain-containing protein n=1 Tax=Sphingomonas sp. 8AM TaxID=2653170 RepID=UPI0012F09024|nr:DUF5872 domain-containing protein [Sphingomonas sp. 8AM]VXD02673.1 conserved hypothetical protein [Sphingomonas sp. 8AM]